MSENDYHPKQAFQDLCSFIAGSAGSNESMETNARFEHGTLNKDGRLDLCKQGFRKAFNDVADAVIEDGRCLQSNARFEYGTLNKDGRLDLCKQGFRKAFNEVADAVIEDGRCLQSNARFEYGTVNKDGRLDLCKQGFREAFNDVADAVVQDRLTSVASGGERQPLIKHYLIGNNNIGENDEDGTRVTALAKMIMMRPDIETWYLAGNHLDKDQVTMAILAKSIFFR